MVSRLSRRSIALVVVAVAVVSAGCVGGIADGSSANASASQTVTTSGTGSVSAAPDQAVVSLAVTATADDAETARERVAANASSLTAALTEAGIPSDAVVTSYYSLHEVSRSDGSTSEYRAVHAFRVTLNGTERAGEIVDLATSNGANRVSSVQFTLSDEARADLRAEALRAAMENARADADVVAEAGGLTVTGVRSVSTSSHTPSPVTYASADSGGASTSFSPGPVSVTATVTVTYDAS
ncbi:SIMPL domain-containing protein [Halocalculus aciditolerans]|uniref:SIMPL domain-containing protein n=1 Tax=Halocalculus aciditolerans TaxID=1383812 RepID=A0A830FF03_9EURY|nr:SIMPL domain-containing protein [Halocalculus aciditolerans]GGL68975.1 SIMPL domain-containing protein [Halocalculus aciditolerans]